MANREKSNHHTQLHVHAICSADIIMPFVRSSGSGSMPLTGTSLVSGTEIDILIDSADGALGTTLEPGDWWRCQLTHICHASAVDSAVSVLTQSGSDWELGWCKPQPPPPLRNAAASGSEGTFNFSAGGRSAASHVQYANGHRRSAGMIAVLKVVCPTSDAESNRPNRRSDATPPQHHTDTPHTQAHAASTWPAHYPPISPSSFPSFPVHSWLSASTPVERGLSVEVHSSPYGLLSPNIFHNTLTTGIVSNFVCVDARPTSSHFGQPTPSDLTTLHSTPPSLLLLDARCFSGSEGAPVLASNGLSSSSSSSPLPLIGLITLPVRHSARGSAVELNLAIPAWIIKDTLQENGIRIWTPPPPPTHASERPELSSASMSPPLGRGEGWRFVDAAQAAAQARSLTRRDASSSIHVASDSVIDGRWSPLTPPRRSRAASRHHPTTSAATQRSNRATPTIALAKLASTSKATITTEPLHQTTSTTHDILTPTSLTRAVGRAEKSVLMARIGGSWASAIAITHDGYLLTNAHLLRPFLDSPDPASAFTPAIPDKQLLFGDSILIKSHVRLSVRVDRHQIIDASQIDYPIDEYGSTDDGSPVDMGWTPATLVYVSQGPWDVAIIKVDLPAGYRLCPIEFHPAARASLAASDGRIQPTPSMPRVGSGAVAIGHALFAPACGLRPTVTAGVLSKVVSLPMTAHAQHHGASGPSSFPALLVTSAAVHNGNSGGLLVDASSGYCLGMVTSNVMHTPVDPNHMPHVLVRTGRDSHASEERIQEMQHKHEEHTKASEEIRQAQIPPNIIPHLNFRSHKHIDTHAHARARLPLKKRQMLIALESSSLCSIPYTALLPLLEFCEGGAQDVHLLYALDNAPDVVQRLWHLTDLTPQPTPLPPFSAKYTALVDAMEKEQQEKAEREEQSKREDIYITSKL